MHGKATQWKIIISNNCKVGDKWRDTMLIYMEKKGIVPVLEFALTKGNTNFTEIKVCCSIQGNKRVCIINVYN